LRPVNPREIGGGQSDTETGFSLEFFGFFLASVIPLWFSILMYLDDEQ
jgi:hypothetical protein